MSNIGERLSVKIRVKDSNVLVIGAEVEEPTLYIKDAATDEMVSCPDWLKISEENGQISIEQENLAQNFYKAGSSIKFKIVDVFKDIMGDGFSMDYRKSASNGSGDGELMRLKLELVIPKPDGVNMMDIKMAAGELSIVGLDISTLNLNTFGGDIDIDEIDSSKVNINTVGGDLHMNNYVVGTLDIKTVSGDAKMFGRQDVIYVKTVSGDFKLSSDRLISKGSIQSVSGDIRFKLRDAHEQNYVVQGLATSVKTVHREKSAKKAYYGGKSGKPLAIQSVSGDFHLSEYVEGGGK